MTAHALTLHTIGNTPLVLDTDLAERLGYEKHENIRHLIARNADELSGYGIICTAQTNTGKRRRPGKAHYLNEEQALLVCVLSKTENAAAVRKLVIDTLMAVRREQQPITVHPELRQPCAPISTC